MGAAGDMLMGALYELYPEKEQFLHIMNSLIPGLTVEAESVRRQGIAGTHMRVVIHGEEEGHGGLVHPAGDSHDHEHDHHHEHNHEHDHHHDHEHDHEHEHEHEHEHHHDHEHEHHHDHDHECDDPNCSCHHHHHHADEVFTSWGKETPKVFAQADIERILTALDSGEYGAILRAKGIVPAADGQWLHFDYVPQEHEVRYGAADYTGRLCVIGSQLKEDGLKTLFGL